VLQTLDKEAVYVAGSPLRCDYLLWGVVVAAAAGDLVLTLFGLSLCFSEANPIARAVIEAGGGAGLLALKLAAVGSLFGIYRYVRPLYGRAALVAFSLPQLFAVGYNGVLLARYAGAC